MYVHTYNTGRLITKFYILRMEGMMAKYATFGGIRVGRNARILKKVSDKIHMQTDSMAKDNHKEIGLTQMLANKQADGRTNIGISKGHSSGDQRRDDGKDDRVEATKRLGRWRAAGGSPSPQSISYVVWESGKAKSCLPADDRAKKQNRRDTYVVRSRKDK